MCYSIPGKVVEVEKNFATVDYFGQRKRARSDFYEISVGDYVYAQGGFVIRKVGEKEAQLAIEAWKDLFDELAKTDIRLTEKKENIREIANKLRREHTGNSSCVHGIIEFSNHCRNNCLYCGLRKDNVNLSRYRMSIEDIVSAADYAVNKLGFKALVFQSGEDPFYDDEKLAAIVKTVMEKNPVLIVLSIGEREISTYKKLYDSGARGVLMRFETANASLYEKYRPGHHLEERLSLLGRLKNIGYMIISGFLLGLPGQSKKDILEDIKTTASMGVEMFSFGPLIPNPDTPLCGVNAPPIDLVLDTIARTRIIYPDSRILVTTATETLDRKNAAQKALLSGANSVMINVTPEEYQSLYYLYPQRAASGRKIAERISDVIELLKSLGRAPSDIGLS